MLTVATTSPFVPAEWIAAHGARPRRVLPAPAAGATGGVLAGICPYAGALLEDPTAGEAADALVAATTCDQMRRAAERIARRGDRPVFLVNVPATWESPAAFRLYVDELRRLGRFLVGLGGVDPSPDRLRGTMATWESFRERVRAAAGVLRAAEAVRVLSASDPAWALDGAAALPATGRPRVPLAVVGGPWLRSDLWLLDLIEAEGGAVVLDGTDTGPRTFPARFDRRRMGEDPFLELAGAYFGAIPDAFRRPDDPLFAWLRREAAAGGARGVVLKRYVWCDLWAASAGRIREATGLPVLDLDTGGDEEPGGRAAQCIRAFLETLR
jgi:benzoyl-CoA reductase/2-hydroxyglutaryl-CoA dehydratase subunit BcrC/BadD/HgdB